VPGVPDGVRPVLTNDVGRSQRGEELYWTVEVGSLQVGGANPLRVVAIRSSTAGQVVAGREEGGLAVELLILDLVPGFQPGAAAPTRSSI
jgi:hypothetical protein